MSKNLTKRDIILEIYEQMSLSQKEVRDVVQMTLDIVTRNLAEGRKVELRNFGVFDVQKRKARVGRNPNKPEKDVMIPERFVIKFKSGKDLKSALLAMRKSK